MLLSLAGCDARPEQRVVLQRDFAWEVLPADGPAPVPPGRRWTGAELVGWHVQGAVGRVAGERLVLEGRGEARLFLPADAVDTRVHHELALELSGRVPGLRLVWSDDGESWSQRGADLAGVDGEQPVRRALGLTHLRPTQADGPLPGMALVIEGPTAEPWSLNVHALSLASELDAAVTTGLDPRSVTRHGVRRPGLAFPAPGAVASEVRGGPGQRLELWLAPVASDAPLTVELSLGGERHVHVLEPGAGWLPVRVALDGLPGERAVPLELRAVGGPGVVLVGGPLRLGPGRERRPDVVLWLVDTLRADRLSSYGYDAATDPTLAALAAEGVRFERVYAASNWTRPSVSTLHTGVGPERHGNHLPGLAVDPELPTLAGQLAAAGYLTVSFNTNPQVGAPSGLDAGFDVEVSPRAFPPLEPSTTLTSAQISGPLFELLERHRGDRLFVSVHSLDPHGPYLPLPEDLEALKGSGARPEIGAWPADATIRFKDRSPRYDAEVLHADRELARWRDKLAELGTADDTLLMFLSDHGESFHEHGTWGHWRSLHEEEVRVPWVLHWPAGLEGGRVVTSPVAHVDVAPTLLGLLDLPAPPAWDGRDLSALARGEVADRPEGVQVVDVFSGESGTYGERRLAAIAGDLKLLVRVEDDEHVVPTALYDLGSDPGEREDLLPDMAPPGHLLDALSEHLARGRERAAGRVAETVVDPVFEQWLEEMGYLR